MSTMHYCLVVMIASSANVPEKAGHASPDDEAPPDAEEEIEL
jgi:hypothetical protein